MFSRSSTTITPSKISHSSLRPLLFLMLNVVLPLGTVNSIGSQAESFTAILTLPSAFGAAGLPAEAVSPEAGAAGLSASGGWQAAKPMASKTDKAMWFIFITGFL